METRYIHYLEMVAEHGSISAAARALDINQPSLTKILHRLETEFGVKFFERGARGVTLTPFGERFLTRARTIRRELRHISAELEDLRSGRAGHITLGAGQMWLSSILPAAIAELHRQLPDVTLTVRTGPRESLLEELRAGDLDIFLGALTELEGMELDIVPVSEIAFVLTARNAHPLLDLGRAVECDDLLDYGWILPPANDPTVTHLRRVFRELGLPGPTAAVEAHSFNVLTHTLRRSDLIGMLPTVGDGGFMDGLVSLDCDWLVEPRTVGVHTVHGRPLIPGARVFMDLVVEVANKLRLEWQPLDASRSAMDATGVTP